MSRRTLCGRALLSAGPGSRARDYIAVVLIACMLLLASPTRAAQPVGADLSHLLYSASGNLSAALVWPADGGYSPGIATKIVVSTVAGAGVELRVNGEVVPAQQIGTRAINRKTGETQYEFYGVVLAPGPNKIELTGLGAGGARGLPSEYTIFGPGRSTRITASLDRPLRADGGKTLSTLLITATDRWDHPAMPGTVLKVTVVSGDVRFRVNLPSTSGEPQRTADSTAVEVPVNVGGVEQLPVVAGLLPGEAVVQITARDIGKTVRFYVDPDLRKPLVTGLVTVGAGSVPGFAGQPANLPDGQHTRMGRIALFGTGVVGSDILANFAYDTANVLQHTLNGPFIADPNDRPFQTYGDTSLHRDDALSSDHLYARFDRGQSSLMWGEFRPNSEPQNSDGAYNLLIDGAKLELGTPRTRVVAFTANNNIAFARQVISPTGLSIVGQTLNPGIVIDSDVLTLIALDKRTGAVLSQTALVRNVDYTIDYATGLLRFINIPLPYDDHFNPQVVLVQYEYSGPGVRAETTGVHASALLDDRGTMRLGAGYINDASGASNFSLLEESLQGTMPGGTWSISHITTRGLPNTVTLGSPVTGGAVQASFTKATGANRIAFAFETTSSGFNNPFGGFSSPGLTNVNLEVKHSFTQSNDLTLDFNAQRNSGDLGNNGQSQASLIYHQRWSDRLSAKLGVQTNILSNVTDTSTGLPVSGSNAQALGGVTFKLGPRLSAGVETILNLGGSSNNPSEPAQTMAQLTYAIPNNTRFYVRERWSALPTDSFASSTSSFTTVAQATQSTSFGFERSLSAATAIDSEYTVDHTSNGPDVYSAMGVREKFDFGKNLHGDAFAQRANAIGSGLGGFFVYGANAAYTGSSAFKAALSLQIRTGSQSGSTLTAGAAGPLGNDFAIQGTLQNSRAMGLFDNEDRVGLAWRPSHNDRGATLLEYDHRIGNVSTLSQMTDAVAIQQVYRPCDRLELAARYALKIDGDAYYAPHTSLWGVRATERFGKRFDFGVEAQLVTPGGIPGARSTDFAIESGYRIGGTARVAVGYNFSGSADPTLTGAPIRRGAYVTVTSVVDRILGWGR